MTILHLGGEIGSEIPSSGAVYEVTVGDQGGNPFNTDNARCAIRIGNSGSYVQSTTHVASAVIGYRWCGAYDNSPFSSEATIFEAFAGATSQVRLIAYDSTGYNMRLEYLDAAAVWQSVGTYVSSRTLTRYEVFIDKPSGVIQLLTEGSVAIDGTGLSLSHFSNFTHRRLCGAYAVAGYISETAICTEANEISGGIETLWAVSDGAETQGSGTYADIDELQYSDADAISFSAGSLTKTFVHSGVNVNNVTLALGLGMRSKVGGSGPTGQKGVLRIGGSNYTSATDTLTAGYGAFCPVWLEDPSTSSAWDTEDVDAVQFGVQSVT